MTPLYIDNPAGLDDPILWNGEALRNEFARGGTAIFYVVAGGFIGTSIWMFAAGATGTPSGQSLGILAPTLALLVGLSSLWLAVSGKGLRPPSAYAISKKHAFVARFGYPGVWDLYCSLDLDRDLQIDSVKGSVAVPVQKECKSDRGILYFSNLSAHDAELLQNVFQDLQKTKKSGD